ncbi:MAG: SIS domain-containing protein [Anaerolineae bacterium]|nr:SIS domain-containing protein [Anaerolineae bacterium]
MTDYIDHYFSLAIDLLQTVQRESGPAIRAAAVMVADALADDKDVLLYGSGHSTLIAQDAAGRAGGLVPFLAMEDVAHGDAERLEGMAQVIAGRYELRAGSVMILISNSGINPVPVEMAMLCKAAGLSVIAITALAHSQAVASRHSSGKKLYELADIVINTHGIPGDARLDLPGGNFKSGATSTLVGVSIVQSMTVQAAALLSERGIDPPVFISANLPQGDAHNKAIIKRYRSRLARYQIPVMDWGSESSES